MGVRSWCSGQMCGLITEELCLDPMCRDKNAVGGGGDGKPPHKINFPRKYSGPCLWFLLRSKSCM